MGLFDLFSGVMSVGGSLVQNSANAREGRANRQFQERMSSTAYQRARKDMESAGLNPYAMYQGTHAASTPGGAQSHQENVTERGIANAMAAREAKARIALLQAQAEKEGALAMDARAEASLKTTTGPGEIPWRVAMMARRAHEMGMQPHQLRGAQLDNMAKELGIPVKQLQSTLSSYGSTAIQAARRGYSQFKGAGEAMGAWGDALQAIIRSNASQVRGAQQRFENEKRRRRDAERTRVRNSPPPSSR